MKVSYFSVFKRFFTGMMGRLMGNLCLSVDDQSYKFFIALDKLTVTEEKSF